MFGKKENDGYLDGLFRAIGQFLIIFAFLAMFWYMICALIEAIRTKPLTVLIWACIIFGFFYFINLQIEQDKKAKALQPKPIEDTRSGKEIWRENMKDYDPVRGY